MSARENAQTLRAQCEAYFRQCDADGRKYTRPGLAIFLDLTPDELAAYERGARGTARATVIQKAVARMSDALQQRTDSVAALLLKQPCYGADGPETGGGLSLAVHIDEEAYGG